MPICTGCNQFRRVPRSILAARLFVRTEFTETEKSITLSYRWVVQCASAVCHAPFICMQFAQLGLYWYTIANTSIDTNHSGLAAFNASPTRNALSSSLASDFSLVEPTKIAPAGGASLI